LVETLNQGYSEERACPRNARVTLMKINIRRIDFVISVHFCPIRKNKFVEGIKCNNECVSKTRLIYQQGRKILEHRFVA
jgi:hypothetical protein